MMIAPAFFQFATTGLSAVAISIPVRGDAVDGRAAFLVDVLLDRDRHAVQRAQRRCVRPRGDRLVRAVGAPPAPAADRSQVTALSARIDRVHPLDARADRLARRDAALADPSASAVASHCQSGRQRSPRRPRAPRCRIVAIPRRMMRYAGSLRMTRKGGAMAVIAVGGFQHETNTFAPSKADYSRVRGTAAAGRRSRFGDAIAPRLAGANIPATGAFDALHAAGHRTRRPRVGRGVALRPRDARRVRAHRRRDDGAAGAGGRRRRRLPRPARRDGHRAPRRRRRRAARARAPHRRSARAGGREPRPARERHARDDGARRRPRRVPHVSARRHGGDRHARGASCSRARSPPAGRWRRRCGRSTS